MADSNNDNIITLGEVRRYLEDHVAKETTPLEQQPMVMGNANEVLFYMNESLLAKLKHDGASRLNTFAAIEDKGLEEQILSTADPSIRKFYIQFYQRIKEKRFFEPDSDCVEFYYSNLISNPSLSTLHPSMTRNYAAVRNTISTLH